MGNVFIFEKTLVGTFDKIFEMDLLGVYQYRCTHTEDVISICVVVMSHVYSEKRHSPHMSYRKIVLQN